MLFSRPILQRFATTRFSVLLWLALAAVACNKHDNRAALVTPPPLVTLVVHVTGLVTNTGATIVVQQDSAVQLSVTATPQSATNPKLTYTSNNTAVVKADTTGLLTGLVPGTATVTVTSVDNGQATQTFQVVVVKNYTVYAAGYGPSATAISPLVWINGQVTVLAPNASYTGANARATGLALNGSDLYVAGQYITNDDWYAACYWKNGVFSTLSNPSNDFNNPATAIALSGSTVVIASYDNRTISFPPWDPTYLNLPIWNGFYYNVNGGAVTRTLLETDTNRLQSLAYAVALSGSDVYVAGAYAAQTGTRIATYWKNDSAGAVALASDGDYSEATGIAVQGSDVYVTGYDMCPNYGCIPTLKLWKNTEASAMPLTNGQFNAAATCLVTNDTAAYIGGYQQNAAGVKQAMLWRVQGNAVTTIPISDGATEAVINAIAIAGNDVFVAGYQVDAASGARVATYWRVYSDISFAQVMLPSGGIGPGASSSEVGGILVR